jgi:hypothetical protein
MRDRLRMLAMPDRRAQGECWAPNHASRRKRGLLFDMGVTRGVYDRDPEQKFRRGHAPCLACPLLVCAEASTMLRIIRRYASRGPSKNRCESSVYRDARCGYALNSARHCRAVDLRSSSSIGNSTQVSCSPNALDAHDGRASNSKCTRSTGRFMLTRVRNSRLGSIKPQVVGNRLASINASIQDASRSAS